MFLQKVNFKEHDTRVKKYILPQKILKTTGKVEG